MYFITKKAKKFNRKKLETLNSCLDFFNRKITESLQ